MLKKASDKFGVPVIVSVLLHVGLVALLGYNAWQYSISPMAGDVNGSSIDAIMVDPSIMTEQYQRQLQYRLNQQQAEKQRQEQVDQQMRALQEKQLAEQARLKTLEKERLLALEKQKQELEAAQIASEAKKKAEDEAQKAKEEQEQQQKQALIAKQKAEEEAALRAQQARVEKERIEQERLKAESEKQKAQQEAELARQEAEKQKRLAAEAKAKAEQEAAKQRQKEAEAKAQAAQEAQQQKMLDDILGGLTSNVPASQKGVSTGELERYKTLVHNAISNKFINPKLYSGQSCVLKIQLASDGLLLNVVSESGDSALCREAISATKLAIFPKPSSNQLYQQVKNLTIDFRPQ